MLAKLQVRFPYRATSLACSSIRSAHSPMIRHLAYILTLAAALQCCPVVHAQSFDNTFTLTVPPVMTLTALRGPQFQNHPNTSANVTFTNSVWLARTASSTGSTVTFTTDHAFQNVSAPAIKRDVQLRLPFMFVSPGSGWAFETNADKRTMHLATKWRLFR